MKFKLRFKLGNCVIFCVCAVMFASPAFAEENEVTPVSPYQQSASSIDSNPQPPPQQSDSPKTQESTAQSAKDSKPPQKQIKNKSQSAKSKQKKSITPSQPKAKETTKPEQSHKEELINKITKEAFAPHTVNQTESPSYLPEVSDSEVDFTFVTTKNISQTQVPADLRLTLLAWLIILLSAILISWLIIYNFKIPLRYEPHTLKKTPHKKYVNLKK